MSQNNLFSRRMLEALREAAANASSQMDRGVGNAAASMDRMPDSTKEQLRSVLEAIREAEKLPDMSISVRIHRPAVCYRCADEGKEAFPYGVTTIFGDEYPFLCNDCWAELMTYGMIASVEDEEWELDEEE